MQAERDEVGTALWSHVCVVVIVMQDLGVSLVGGEGQLCVGVSPVGAALSGWGSGITSIVMWQ